MHKVMRALLAALALTAGGLAQAAPQGHLTVYGEPPRYPDGFSHFDYVNPDAPKGGTLRRSAEDDPFDHLIPFVDKGNGVSQVDGWVYARLGYRSLDEPYTVYGWVARQFELAPNHSWLRLYLEPTARFDDGTPITAEDVRFTFDVLMNEGSLRYRQQFADVASVEVESPRQVRFVFKRSDNRNLPLDIASLPVLPEHAWRGRDFASGAGYAPLVGSGPYRVVRVDPGRSVQFERVRDWWGRDLPVSRGMYNFDHLSVEFFADAVVARQVLKAGGYDYNRELSASGYMAGYQGEALDQGRLLRAQLAPGSARSTQGFVFNLNKPMFQDRRVRQAIAMLWDFEWSNRHLMHGMYIRQRSFFSHTELAASQLPDANERALLAPLKGRVPDEVFDTVYQAPRSDGSGIVRDQQLQALQLLESAGWRPSRSRLVDAQGRQLAFTFLNNQKGFERLLLPFKRNLAQIGIRLDIRQVDPAQYTNRVRARDYDMIVVGYPVSPSPGAELYNYFGSRVADDPGSNNYMALRDTAVDQLIDGLVQAPTRASMVEHARALDRVLQWGHYWIPNYYPPGQSSVWWNRFGRPDHEAPNALALDTWWEASPQATAQGQSSSRAEGEQHAGL